MLARFRVLLETSAGRIKKADLPSRLGIESAEWLFDSYDGGLYYSKDSQSVLSVKDTQSLTERMRALAREEFVPIAALASENDIAYESCDRLLAHVPGIRPFALSDGSDAVCDVSLLDHMRKQLLSEIEEAGTEKVDLTSAHPSVPPSALLRLAEQALQQSSIAGEVIKKDERVLYVPADYDNLQRKQQEGFRRSQISAAVKDLATGGYCELKAERRDRAADVKAKFREQHGDFELTFFEQTAKDSSSTAIIIAKDTSVDEAMAELRNALERAVRTSRSNGDFSSSLKTLEPSLCAETSHLGLTNRLLASSEHRKLLETSLASAVRTLQDEESQQFAMICQTLILAPLELYARGLESVVDATLKERLSEYVCEHLRGEMIPGLAQALQKGGLLNDKSRSKDIDKLTAACAQAKDVADLQSAVSKFCRKQKISVPDANQLSAAKRDTLQDKVKNVQKMSRGSDILQNLIWILLAENNEGLFLSAGKDTSRMIKHYQSVGDAEKGQKLEGWRDALKAGKQSDEDVQDMKAMAVDVVKSICREVGDGT